MLHAAEGGLSLSERRRETQQIHDRTDKAGCKSFFSALDHALLISETFISHPFLSLFFPLADNHGAVQPLLTKLCCHGEEL